MVYACVKVCIMIYFIIMFKNTKIDCTDFLMIQLFNGVIVSLKI